MVNKSYFANTAELFQDLNELHANIIAVTDSLRTHISDLNFTLRLQMNRSWIRDASATTAMTYSMVSNWPDAIGCNVSGWGFTIFYLVHVPYSANNQFEYRSAGAVTLYDVRFNADGTYYGVDNVPSSDCDDRSIDELRSAGQAFNFGYKDNAIEYSLQVSNQSVSLPNLSGIWQENSGKLWRITTSENFYSLDGLDFGTRRRKAAGIFIFNDEWKASTTWWENGSKGETLIVTLFDEDTLQLTNGDTLRRI